MSQNDDNTSAEFHMEHLGADAVTSNIVGPVTWDGWGRMNIESLKASSETVESQMKRAKLFFTPTSVTATIKNPITGNSENLDTKAILNAEGDVIGEVGSGFNPMGHYQTLEKALDLIVKEGFIPARFIAFDNGARMLAQFAVDSKYYIAGREQKAFVTLYNGLDGTMSVRIGHTLYTPVCCNTFAAAMHDLDGKVKHTLNMGINLTKVSAMLGLVRTEIDSTMKTIETLNTITADSETVKAFLEAMLPKDEASKSNAVNNRRAELASAITRTQLEVTAPSDLLMIEDTIQYNNPSLAELLFATTRYTGNRLQKRDTLNQLDYISNGAGGKFNTSAYAYLKELAHVE